MLARADASVVMPLAVLTATIRLLTASWRGQLAVLAVAAVTLGVVQVGAGASGDLWLRTSVASICVAALAAASMRVAIAQEEDAATGVQDEAVAVLALLPRIIVQCALVVVPFLLLQGAVLWIAGKAAILGVVLVALLFVVAAVLVVLVGLALAAVVHGDRRWAPTLALSALRRAPVQLTCSMLLGGIVAALCSLVLIVPGLVIAAIAGPAGALGTGLAAASLVPWIGCGVLASWRATGCVVEDAHPDADDASSMYDESSLQHLAEIELACWDVAIDPAAVWGTWVQLPAGIDAGVMLAWSPGAIPELLLAGPDGAWVRPAQPVQPGDVVNVALPAGATWLQVGTHGPAPQAVSIRLLDRSRRAA